MRYSHLAVDVLNRDVGGAIHMIFVVSRDSGGLSVIQKLSHAPRSGRTCLVQVLQPFTDPAATRVLAMKFTVVTNSLYLGTDTSVVRMGVERCRRFVTREQCSEAADPYCGWDGTACTVRPDQQHATSWSQQQLDCPAQNLPVRPNDFY